MYTKVYIKRREHNLTQKYLAEKLYMSIPSYQNRENGKLEFTIKEGKKLSEFYNCTLDDLFGNREYKGGSVINKKENEKELIEEMRNHFKEVAKLLETIVEEKY